MMIEMDIDRDKNLNSDEDENNYTPSNETVLTKASPSLRLTAPGGPLHGQ